MTAPAANPVAGAARKPRDDELDIYGLTHAGRVRRENQDHFLICSLRKQMLVHHTSLPASENLPAGGERLALVAMVADGVGGAARGEEAAPLAVETVTRYISGSMRCYYAANDTDDAEFSQALEDAA